VLPFRTTTSCRFVGALTLIGWLLLAGGASLHAAPQVIPERGPFPLSLRWSIDLAGPPLQGASPVADPERVYLAMDAGTVVAYDAQDGKERWRRELVAVQPLIVDAGIVFAATKSTICALRAEDGGTIWEAPVAVTAPLLAHAGWLIAIAAKDVVAIRAADGSRVWHNEVGESLSQPAIDGDRLFISLTNKQVVALSVPSGAPLWERALEGVPESPFATNDRVYVGASDRRFYCVKQQNGEVDWTQRIGSAPVGHAAADRSHLYVVALDNVLRAYDRGNGNQRWTHPLKRRAATGPEVLGAMVLVPSAASPEIWVWTAGGKAGATVTLPAEPAVPPAFVDRGADGAFIFVVTGGLANQWRLALLAPAPDLPLVPFETVPGTALKPEEPVDISSRTVRARRLTPSSIRSGVGAENDSRMVFGCDAPTKNASPAT
jgi:outer membrane protein assembly factor BamB